MPSLIFLVLQPVANFIVFWITSIVATWIYIAIACLIYNFVAGRIGGIEVELEPVQER